MVADAAFYSAKNEAAATAKGVNASAFRTAQNKSLERKREQRKRWFRNGQKWRTGSEGRISVVRRRHGLDRCRYRGYVGWVLTCRTVPGSYVDRPALGMVSSV